MKSLEKRIAELEKTVKRLEALNARSTGELRVERLVIVNDSGKPILELSADDDGAGCVRLMNARKRECVVLQVDDNGGGLITTRNARGKAVIQIGQCDEGNGEIWVSNRHEEVAVELSGLSEGGGLITTRNARGKAVIQIGQCDEGNGEIWVNNRHEEVAVALGALPEGSGHIATRNRAGHNIVEISETEGDGGRIATRDSDGSEWCSMACWENGGGFYANDGESGVGACLVGSLLTFTHESDKSATFYGVWNGNPQMGFYHTTDISDVTADSDNYPRVLLGVGESGTGYFEICGSNRERRIELAANDGPGFLATFDPDGSPMNLLAAESVTRKETNDSGDIVTIKGPYIGVLETRQSDGSAVATIGSTLSEAGELAGLVEIYNADEQHAVRLQVNRNGEGTVIAHNGEGNIRGVWPEANTRVSPSGTGDEQAFGRRVQRAENPTDRDARRGDRERDGS